MQTQNIANIGEQQPSNVLMTEQDQMLLSLLGKLQMYFFGKLACISDNNPRTRKTKERIEEEKEEILQSIVEEIDSYSIKSSSEGGIYC